jgi:hypothetical protein
MYPNIIDMLWLTHCDCVNIHLSAYQLHYSAALEGVKRLEWVETTTDLIKWLEVRIHGIYYFKQYCRSLLMPYETCSAYTTLP